MLSQLIDDRLARAKNVLVAGAGGGYDVVCGVPLIIALESRGIQVHVASLISTPINDIDGGVVHQPELVEVTAKSTRPSYFPEGWLSRWLTHRFDRDVSVYCFGATGVGPLYASYQHLIETLDIDCVIAVDGGVDSLLRGDEYSLGSPLEDALTIAALSLIDGTDRILAAVGLGAERLDRISHAQVLARIADLQCCGAWLGAEALTGATADEMRAVAGYVLSNQQGMHNSVVVGSVVASLEGKFGDHAVTPHSVNTPPWVSPLMSLFWYFDLAEVARQNLYLARLLNTSTFNEAAEALGGFVKTRPKRGWEEIPI
jgi:hypothetical protein